MGNARLAVIGTLVLGLCIGAVETGCGGSGGSGTLGLEKPTTPGEYGFPTEYRTRESIQFSSTFFNLRLSLSKDFTGEFILGAGSVFFDGTWVGAELSTKQNGGVDVKWPAPIGYNEYILKAKSWSNSGDTIRLEQAKLVKEDFQGNEVGGVSFASPISLEPVVPSGKAPDLALLVVSGHDVTGHDAYLAEDAAPFLLKEIAARLPDYETIEVTHYADVFRPRKNWNVVGYWGLKKKLEYIRDNWPSPATKTVIVAHSHGGVHAHAAILHTGVDVDALIDLDTNQLTFIFLHNDGQERDDYDEFISEVTDFNDGFINKTSQDKLVARQLFTTEIEDFIPASVRANLEVRATALWGYADTDRNVRDDGSAACLFDMCDLGINCIQSQIPGDEFNTYWHVPENHSQILDSDGDTLPEVADWLIEELQSPCGSLSWVKRGTSNGTTSTSTGTSVSTLTDGSSFVAGQFSGDVTFGEGAAAVSLTSPGTTYNGFLLRYDRKGKLLWANEIGGATWATARDVSALAGGSSIVAGNFQSTVTLGEGTAAVTLEAVSGFGESFVARYTGTGTLDWATRIGVTSGDAYVYALGTSVSVEGACLVTGYFKGSATFGAGAGAVTLQAVGGSDAFLARYAADGSLDWVEKAGSSGSSLLGIDVAAQSDGSCVVTGQLFGSGVFGSGAASVRLTSAGSRDVFIARYRANGELDWAVSAGGTGNDYAYTISVHPDDSFFVGGSFGGTATFGEGPVAVDLVAAGSADAFVAKYSADGLLYWAARGGGGSYTYCVGVSAAADGSCVLTGYFYGTATFATEQATTLTSGGAYDIFFARCDSSGRFQWATRAGGSDSCAGVGVSCLTDGSFVATGNFRGSATFGEGQSSTTLTTTGWYRDAFISRYLRNGGL